MNIYLSDEQLALISQEYPGYWVIEYPRAVAKAAADNAVREVAGKVEKVMSNHKWSCGQQMAVIKRMLKALVTEKGVDDG